MRRLFILFPLLLGQIVGLALSFTQDKGRLVKLELIGLDRYTRDQVIARSGLREGEVYSLRDFDAAAQRLKNTGLFAKLEYQALTANGETEAVFSLQEVQWDVPVAFDDFIWFSDEEMVSELAQRIPGFDGNAPATSEPILEEIRTVLQDLLWGKGIQGRVAYMPAMEYDRPGSSRPGKVLRHIYQVEGVDLTICSLGFPQASAIAEKKLIELAKPLIGSRYSFRALDAFLKRQLLPLYLNSGHIQASFAKPVATPVSGAPCPSGVSVEIPVDEGSQYRMGQVAFYGLPEKEARRLTKKWKLNAGQVYDASYVAVFLQKKIPGKLKSKRSLEVRANLDQEARLVDLTFAFSPGNSD